MKQAKRYCKDDIRKIENYESAVSDKKRYVCHHRLELTLDGESANSRADLIRMDMYYNRPYYELIFMPQGEHIRLHQNTLNSFKGKRHSKESLKGKAEWSSKNIGSASKEYQMYKLNGGTLKWNDWEKRKFNVNS